MTTAVDDGRLRELEAAVRRLSVGTVRVLGATAARDWDQEGDEFIDLVVTLSDPVAGAVTWPLDDWLAISKVVRETTRKETDVGVRVTFTNPTAGTEDEPPDEALEDGDTGE